jgi:hypothetical protein
MGEIFWNYDRKWDKNDSKNLNSYEECTKEVRKSCKKIVDLKKLLQKALEKWKWKLEKLKLKLENSNWINKRHLYKKLIKRTEREILKLEKIIIINDNKKNLKTYYPDKNLKEIPNEDLKNIVNVLNTLYWIWLDVTYKNIKKLADLKIPNFTWTPKQIEELCVLLEKTSKKRLKDVCKKIWIL